VAAAGIYGILQTQEYYNGGTNGIKSNEILFVGMDFTNAAGASFSNEGQVHFLGHVRNEGSMGCGACASGVSYLAGREGLPQMIEGSQPIVWHDGVLDNPDGADLGLELRILNSFSFSQGVLTTDRATPAHFLHFQAGALSAGSEAGRHVNGYAGWSGSGSFRLPLGNGTRLMPVEIAASASGSFKAAFFTGDPSAASLPAGAPFARSAFDAVMLDSVYGGGFWAVEGNVAAEISLFWDAASQMGSFVQSLDSLVVAGWDGSQWRNLGNSGQGGSLSAGFVRSSILIPSDYEAFAIAKASVYSFPVEWLSFSASLRDADALLEWATASEVNSDHFEVQRSADGRAFEAIGQVGAAGNASQVSEYSFRDAGASYLGSPVLYYRLRQVDLDGRFEYSRVESLRFDQRPEALTLTLFPNPSQGVFSLQLQAEKAGSYPLEILSISGQQVFQGQLEAGKLTELRAEGWADGSYVVSARAGAERVSRTLILKR
jgi:hypothetical protein